VAALVPIAGEVYFDAEPFWSVVETTGACLHISTTKMCATGRACGWFRQPRAPGFANLSVATADISVALALAKIDRARYQLRTASVQVG
jgi:hypothetical protein